MIAALGACVSQGPRSAGQDSGTTLTPPGDSLSDLSLVTGPASMLILAANGGELVGAVDGGLHYYVQDPGSIASAAFTAHVSVCPVEFDNLVLPPAASTDVVNSLNTEFKKCDTAVSPTARTTLMQLKTPSTVVIVGANAAATWHTTSNDVSYFYGDDILFMLHAARQLNVSACVVAPSDIALPMAPSGMTAGVSIADALAGCGLPP